jgi:hypothetical protein
MLPGALAERTTADGRRRIQLTNDERDEALFHETIEHAVALYLDLRGRHTNQQIADELGISVHQLKNLTCTEEFEACWNENAADLGHDPRLKASQNALLGLLPDAVMAVEDVLANGSSNAKVQAAKMVFDLNGVVKRTMTDSNKKEMIDFLTGKSAVINQTNVQINVPQEFTDTLEHLNRAIDGEFVEVPEPIEADIVSDVGKEIEDESEA